MKIEPFGVEIWMNANETRCSHNLAETCVESLTVAELLELAGANGGLDALLPLLSTGQPETTLFKFPTNLVSWYFDGVPASPGNDTLSRIDTVLLHDTILFHFEQRPDLDDVFSGRLVTFDEGPLAGHTFRVLRSFGRQNGQPENGRVANAPPTTRPPTTVPLPLAPTPVVWLPPGSVGF